MSGRLCKILHSFVGVGGILLGAMRGTGGLEDVHFGGVHEERETSMGEGDVRSNKQSFVLGI